VVPDVPTVGYVIWGVDHAVYGPVELPVLVSWIRDERVLADTWLFVERNGCWEQAARIPELQMFFHKRSSVALPAGSGDTSFLAPLQPGALRHVKVLACLNDEQLAEFLQFVEVQTVPAGTQLIRRGEPASAMYLVVEGELRYSLAVEGREATAGSLNAGEFFGEISLLDQGTRNADVVAVQDCTLLKISAVEFERMTAEKPGLVAPFLSSLMKSVACRVRAENRRYRDSVCFIQPANR
jgi:CRP-like cAMP-binding protein